MKLNIGCNQWKLKGFHNIDIDPAVNPDEVVDGLNMPYPDKSIQTIYAGHFLEHLSWEEGQLFFKKCYALLIPGGEIMIVVPDFEWVAREYTDNRTKLKKLNDMFIYSYEQKEHVAGELISRHKYCYDDNLLKQALQESGFVKIKKMPQNHPYYVAPVAWQIGWKGVKPNGK